MQTNSSKLQLKLLSPSRPLADCEVGHVSVPTEVGQLGVLPGHAALAAKMAVGIVEVKQLDGASIHYFTSGGHLEIYSNQVTVLVETAETASDIDEQRAKKAEERALQRLSDRSTLEIDIPRALTALERARARRKLASITSKT